MTKSQILRTYKYPSIDERREFNRCWTRLEVEDGAPVRASRLALRSEGESIRFGDALPVHELNRIARELRRVLARR